MGANRHVGPWRDTARSAVTVAFEEVNVDESDFVLVEQADTVLALPWVGKHQVLAEVTFSAERDQYRATATRFPYEGETA